MRKALNYLLVMPRLVQNANEGYVFPLGLAYISASLKKGGFRVFTLNLNHVDGDVPKIVADTVRQHRIDVIGTGGLSPQYHMIKAVLDGARQGRGDIITIVGGGIISAEPPIAMAALEIVDYGVIGEGEITICDLAEALETGRQPATVSGIIYRTPEGFHTTSPREDIADLDSLPWPDYAGFDVEKYLSLPSAGFGGVGGERLLCLAASRSCPFHCTFCFHTNGFRYRQRSLDSFFAELDHVVKTYQVKHISLADELFAPDLERAKEFCRRIQAYNVTWFADFRVDKITPDLLKVMKESGLGTMFLGLESADNRILRSMRKAITIEKIERALEDIDQVGIPMFGCFIFGDVAETYETAQNTLNWWRAHPQYQIHLTLLKPFPGSQVYADACQNQIITDKIKYLKDGCPQVNISRLSAAEFADIAGQIARANDLNQLSEIQLLALHDETGRADISACCPACQMTQTWTEVRLFSIDYLYCQRCGRKYPIPCPSPAVRRIETNIRKLTDRYGKVALWGMTTAIMELIKLSGLRHCPDFFPIDISLTKATLDLNGKKITLPDIINSEGIPLVIIAIPSHAGQIRCQIQANHPGVHTIMDLSEIMASTLLSDTPPEAGGHNRETIRALR